MMGVVVDATGMILRKVRASSEAALALQAGEGETVLKVEGHDGTYINDARVKIDLTEGEGHGLFVPIDAEDTDPVPGGRAVALEIPA